MVKEYLDLTKYESIVKLDSDAALLEAKCVQTKEISNPDIGQDFTANHSDKKEWLNITLQIFIAENNDKKRILLVFSTFVTDRSTFVLKPPKCINDISILYYPITLE